MEKQVELIARHLIERNVFRLLHWWIGCTSSINREHQNALARLWIESNALNHIRFVLFFCVHSPCCTAQDLWTHLTAATDLTALKQHLQEIVQENISTLLAVSASLFTASTHHTHVQVAESVWSLLSANISFIGGLIGALLGLLLSFGLDLLNFVIEVVVFFTMLYYLLASSRDQWKPMVGALGN